MRGSKIRNSWKTRPRLSRILVECRFLSLKHCRYSQDNLLGGEKRGVTKRITNTFGRGRVREWEVEGLVSSLHYFTLICLHGYQRTIQQSLQFFSISLKTCKTFFSVDFHLFLFCFVVCSISSLLNSLFLSLLFFMFVSVSLSLYWLTVTCNLLL